MSRAADVAGYGYWVDTGAGNDLEEQPGLFGPEEPDGVPSRSTRSTATNVHSHWKEEGSENWSGYELGGRFRIDESGAGVGVTVLSAYPDADHYYRLRSYNGRTFELAPHGTQVTGDTTTDVVPRKGRWYRFVVRTEVGSERTRILASVWRDGDSQPAMWQIDCEDRSADRRQRGTVGLWAMGDGAKHWSDLRVDGQLLPVEDVVEEPSAPADTIDPGTWLDTGAGNDLEEAAGLFRLDELNGVPVRATSSTETNIHSHWQSEESALWSNYELAGRFRISEDGAGIGVTLLSGFPDANHYYRIRSYRGERFELAPHGTEVRGELKSDVRPRAGVWYRFRVRVEVDSTRTRILAMVWRDGASQPTQWQINGEDRSAARRRQGTVGLWAMSGGDKYWADLTVDGERLPLGDGDSTTDGDTTDGDTTDGDTTDGGDDTTSDGDTSPTDPVLSGTVAVGSGGWIDTGEGNSLQEEPGLFALWEADGEPARGTDSESVNIHSHWSDDGSAQWGDYAVTGRLLVEKAGAGIGVTFLSAYPEADHYYRLRSYEGGVFHIAPHGTSITAGDPSTGIEPVPGVWYRFAIEVRAGTAATEIRAAVWRADGAAPSTWQIDCLDESGSRRSAGTVGLWAMGTGLKLWSHLEVDGQALPLDNGDDSALEPSPDTGSVALAWDPPVADEDGSSLDDLAGYFVYYRRASGGDATREDVGLVNQCTVDGLESDTWEFQVTAYDLSGNESTPSGEVSVEVSP